MKTLSARIALRNIFSKKSHSAVNLISIVAVCGIVVTTAAIVCVLSVFNGFSRLVEDKLALLDPDVKVSATVGKTISMADSIAGQLMRLPSVALAMPVVADDALAVYDERQMPVSVKGVPCNYDSMTSLPKLIKEDGTFLLSENGYDYAILSVGVAISFQAHPGYVSTFQLYAPKRVGRINVNVPADAFRADTLFVSGVFQTDQAEYDMTTVYVPIDVARSLFDYTDEATAIEVKVADGYAVDDAMADIAAALGEGYEIKDRLMQQEASFRMINIEKWISFLLLGFILIISAFNIISSISVLIVEKDEAISTLSILGGTKSLITSVFTAQTWIISLAGTLLGMILGVALCLIQEYFGVIKLGSDTSALIIDAYPVEVRFSDLLIVLVLTVAVTAMSALATVAVMRGRLRRQ